MKDHAVRVGAAGTASVFSVADSTLENAKRILRSKHICLAPVVDFVVSDAIVLCYDLDAGEKGKPRNTLASAICQREICGDALLLPLADVEGEGVLTLWDKDDADLIAIGCRIVLYVLAKNGGTSVREAVLKDV